MPIYRLSVGDVHKLLERIGIPMSYTGTQKLLAEHGNGKLIAAATRDDGTEVIVVEDGRKLTFTPDEVEQIKAEATAKATATIKAKKKDSTAPTAPPMASPPADGGSAPEPPKKKAK